MVAKNQISCTVAIIVAVVISIISPGGINIFIFYLLAN